MAVSTPPIHERTRRGAFAGGVSLLLLASALLTFPPVGHATPVAPGAAPVTPPAFPTPIRHVMVVYLENQEAKDVLANGSYERSLASTYAYADQFYSPMHYSLPNYLAATSGFTSNVFAPVKQVSVGSLSSSIGRTWKEYEEAMPTACDLSANITAGGYDPYHNPFALYMPFINNSAGCHQHMVNFTKWNSDVAHDTVPNYAFIVPNTTHDGHDTGLPGAESWLSAWLPPLLNDSFFQTTALFVAYDEGTTNLGANGSVGGGRVYVTLVSPYAHHGFVSEQNYTTYSLLTTTEWLLALGSTKTHDNWATYPPMRDLFDFPVAVTGTVVDRNGTAIPSIAVSDHHGHAVTSNASGGFSIQLRDGSWTLYVSPLSGYKGNVSVTVDGNPVSGVVLTVKKVS